MDFSRGFTVKCVKVTTFNVLESFGHRCDSFNIVIHSNSFGFLNSRLTISSKISRLGDSYVNVYLHLCCFSFVLSCKKKPVLASNANTNIGRTQQALSHNWNSNLRNPTSNLNGTHLKCFTENKLRPYMTHNTFRSIIFRFTAG